LKKPTSLNKEAIFPNALRMTDNPHHQCPLKNQQPLLSKASLLVIPVMFLLNPNLSAVLANLFMNRSQTPNCPLSESDVSHQV
jgi:hypothetical protein